MLDAVHFLFDQGNDGFLDHLCRCAGIGDVEGDGRLRNLRILRDRQLADGQRAGKQDEQRDHPGKDWTIDEKFG